MRRAWHSVVVVGSTGQVGDPSRRSGTSACIARPIASLGDRSKGLQFLMRVFCFVLLGSAERTRSWCLTCPTFSS